MAAMMNMNNLLNGKDSRWLQLEVCREFQRNKCSRQDTECKFAHPPANVEVQNGKVTACYDSIKGRCNREKPPCKYFHPPQHLKDQLLINGRNHLALKNALMQQMAITSGQPVMPGQVPAVNGTTSVPPLGFSVTVGSQPIMATNPYLTGIPASTYSPYFAPGHLVPALLGPDPSTVASQLGPVVPQAVPVAQQKIARSDRLEVCREFMRGACKRAESECRFAHPQESVTTHEDGSVTVCMDAVKGRCARDLCRYFHPPLHLQAQIKTAQLRAVATAPVSAAAAAGPVLTAAVAAAAMTHPIPTPGAAPSTAMALGHPLEVGKKRAAENDMFQLMDMKTVGSFYYENFAFSGMVPYKRPAAEKSGIPVYQPGATTYQQLMQLQQPFVPVSCEYPSPSPSATTAIPQPQSSTTANPIANNNKNQINLNNNSNGVVVSNRTLLSSLSSNISNSTLSSSNGVVVTTASLQNSIQQNHLINAKNNVNNNSNNNRSITGNNTNNANNDNNNNINTNNNNNVNNILNSANSNSSTNNSNAIPNGAVPPKSDSNSNNSMTNNATSVSNNPTPPGNNNFNNVNTTQLTVTTTASTPPTTTSDDVNVKTDHTANNATEVVVSSQPPQQTQPAQSIQTSHILNNHHANNTNHNQIHGTPTHHFALHNQHQAQTLQNHLHHTASQNSLNASFLSYPPHSNAITVPHPSIQMAAGHHQAYYHDPAAIAKEVAQKNYANALKMAAVSGSISVKPMSALTYTGVALNKAMMPQHPGAAAAAAVAAATNHSAAVANRMASPLAGVVNNVPQSTPSFMTRPPPGFVQASLIRQHVGLTPSGAPTAPTAQNPYSAGTAAVGNAQFLNHQNFFYPGIVAGYPFGMSASGASGLGGHAVAQTVPANLAAASMSAMQGVPQVGAATATPGSAVVLNPYKKMKTS